MTKEIPVHQQIQPQEYVDEKYHLSTGEVIHYPHQRGMVGWLDQTESEPGSVKTAKMELVRTKYALYVYPKFRISELKVGSELFERLFRRLKTKSYQVLNINMVTPELYDFYLNNMRAAVAQSVDPTRGRGRIMALKLSTPGQMGKRMSKIHIFLRVIFGKQENG